MKINGSIELSHLLDAIGLAQVPSGCEFSEGEFVDIDVEADEDEIIDDLVERGLWSERDQLPLHDLKDAFAALKAGDVILARQLFCRMLDQAEAAVVEDALLGQEALPL